MPEYFGAPYANEFMVDLPLNERKTVLERQQGKGVSRNGVHNYLKLNVTIDDETTDSFAFKFYSLYKRFS